MFTDICVAPIRSRMTVLGVHVLITAAEMQVAGLNDVICYTVMLPAEQGDSQCLRHRYVIIISYDGPIGY